MLIVVLYNLLSDLKACTTTTPSISTPSRPEWATGAKSGISNKLSNLIVTQTQRVSKAEK